MHLLRDPTLSPLALLRRPVAPPEPLASTPTIYCAYGRFALWLALKLCRAQPGDNVLLPAYVCDVVTHPLADLGLVPRYYDVGEDLAVDPAAVLGRADSRTRAALVVHYFGLPQPNIERLAREAQAAGVLLVEDCAHSLLSRLAGRPLGSFGDLSIFSLRKTLPLPHGAALVVNSGRLLEDRRLPTCEPPAGPGGQAAQLLRSLATRLEAHHRVPLGPLRAAVRRLRGPGGSRAVAAAQPPSAEQAAVDFPFADCQGAASGWVLRVIRSADYRQIVARRRDSYAFLWDRLSGGHGLQLPGGSLAEGVAEGVCPLVFPLLCDQREALRQRLLAAGIDAYPWPYLPDDLPRQQFASVWRLAERMLLLPVHQDVTSGELQRMADILLTSTVVSGRRSLA